MSKKTPIKSNSKLIKLLQLIDSTEVEGFIKYIQSRYFVKPNSKKVLEKLLDFSPKYEHSCFTWEDIFSRAFPSESYNRKKLQRIFSDINQIIEDFLAYQLLRKKPHLLGKIKAISLYQRIDFSAYSKIINKSLDGFEKQVDLYTDFEVQTLKQLQYYYPFSEKERDVTPSLAAVNQSLDQLYVLNKLRFYCEYQNRSQIYSNQEYFTFEEEVLKMGNLLRSENSIIDLYVEIIQLKETEQSKKLAHFLVIKEKLFQRVANLPKLERSIIIITLTNFTIQQHYLNIAPYRRFQLELYQLGLTYQLYSPKGYFAQTTFINIVNTAIAVNEFRFAENFIEQYSPLLRVEYTSIYKALAKAFLFFYRKEYEPAHEELLKLESHKIFHNLPTRFLQVRLIFEFFLKNKTYKTTLNSQLSSFKSFVTNHPLLTPKRKQTYLNHLIVLEEIRSNLLYDNQYITESCKIQLVEKIKTLDPLIGKTHLLEKVHLLYEKGKAQS